MLKRLLDKNSIECSEYFYEQIEIYKKTLKRWSKIHNITNITKDDDIDRYIFDSLYPIKFIKEFSTALDIGSGAGFPGFVLALYFGESHFTLCEPNSKKVSFLLFAKVECGAKNIKIASQKVEDLNQNRFDLITSRALMSTPKLLDISKNCFDKKTQIILYKGEKLEDELKDCVDIDYEIIKANKIQYLNIRGEG